MYQEKQRWFEQTAKRDQETKNKSVSFLGFSWKIGLEPTCEGIGKREAVGWGERGGVGGGGNPVLSMSVPSKTINLYWP